MRRTVRRRVAVWAIALLLLGAPVALGGQVRVNVGAPTNRFTPYAVNINQGDHVVWVWIAGSHTVTNWTSPDDSMGVTIDGSIFDSDPGGMHFGQGTTTRYSWKSDRSGALTYLCVPHSDVMLGRVFVSPLTTPPTIPVADFRLTEVQFNVPGGQDRIEIANLGNAAGNMGRFRLAVLGTGNGVELAFNDFAVPAGGRVIIQTAAGGPNIPPADIILAGLGDLPDAAGSVALYAPSTLSFQNALTKKDLMLDYVQWGAGNQPNEMTAGQANFWAPGTSINGVAAGHSIEYCQNSALDHGVAHWAEISPPNFGGPTSDCTTPTVRDTWGHLKIIYRR